jgi:hypothetical protein
VDRRSPPENQQAAIARNGRRAHARAADGHWRLVPAVQEKLALKIRNIQQYDTTFCAGGIDVRATANGGEVTEDRQPYASPGGAPQAILPARNEGEQLRTLFS